MTSYRHLIECLNKAEELLYNEGIHTRDFIPDSILDELDSLDNLVPVRGFSSLTDIFISAEAYNDIKNWNFK